LGGCANQALSVEPSVHTSANSTRAWSKLARSRRIPFNTRGAPIKEDVAAAASADQADELTTGSLPANATPTSLAQPAPDPRTARALNCRETMLKKHPTTRVGGTGSATAQRDFFDSCMRQAGNSP
jgi:hypothetical protein